MATWLHPDSEDAFVAELSRSKREHHWCECGATLDDNTILRAASNIAQFRVGAFISRDFAQCDFVDFTVREGWEHILSGFSDCLSPAHVRAMPHRVRQVRTSPLRHFLPDLRHVDLMLVDVEGAENEVLDGIGFEDLLPRWLMIENDKEPGGSDALRGRILAAGYGYIARIGGTDDLFARRMS